MSTESNVLVSAVPLGAVTQCRVVRSQIHGSRRAIAYDLHTDQQQNQQEQEQNQLQEQQQNQHVLRATRTPRTESIFSRYSYDICLARSSSVVGQVVSNATGTEFSIIQRSEKPEEEEEEEKGGSKWTEVCAIVYKPRDRKFGHRRGPRKMAVVIRAVDSSGKAADDCSAVPLAAKYHACVSSGHDTDAAGSIVALENKAPRWNARAMAYMLDFGGRVTMASSKNLQLISMDCDRYVVVQFGKTDRDVFTLDFRFPVSPVMAFGIAVSVMVRKNNALLFNLK
ncbi:hypothetical protein LPJ81_001783 [Coemansia sp. IMI 209127]|nr:hypothetical protein LPJ81_001783 [Coemansia sp. IMI 209127]